MFDFKNASKDELQNEYNRIAKEMGDDQFFTKKELHYLPQVLREGEQVLGFSSGLMDGSTWLITLTDKRIIFLDKGMIYGMKQEIIPLNRVNAVSGSTGIFFGKIIITDGAKSRKIENVWKKTVKNFTNKVQEALETLEQVKNNTQSQQTSKSDDDPYEKLEKLASLKDRGIITDEEFAIEKKKILCS
ncbi:PH domain-containing protein [Serpentinicella sp. ANB-PHB4]|uniref:PH domain-containing protein n=1 Tax=Serpentinicella sp. ANB-PHB4 TaxID=3074076 RepID=UPI00286776A9|nr:PH domain-containing protein [Serpentinicella sp. ANB-PHB4]MDR5658818.1 PH domain-containing protein [Serpentinicella sp. ANB-PHB4]